MKGMNQTKVLYQVSCNVLTYVVNSSVKFEWCIFYQIVTETTLCTKFKDSRTINFCCLLCTTIHSFWVWCNVVLSACFVSSSLTTKINPSEQGSNKNHWKGFIIATVIQAKFFSSKKQGPPMHSATCWNLY